MTAYPRRLFAIGCWIAISGATAAADPLHVCVEAAKGCDFAGATGIQDAVDAAPDGAHIVVRRGRYHPRAHRDFPFSDEGENLSVRGFVAIDGKHLSITGEQGAVLDGSSGKAASAIVARNSRLHIQGIEIKGFWAAEKEDNIYDGHGIFLIDSEAVIGDVTIRDVQKMALTGRGSSQLNVENLRITDSHLGIWLEEDATLELGNAHIENSESAGIAAYDRSSTVVLNSSFVGNEDDGLYATGAARICVTSSRITGNKPYGVRAVEDGQIHIAGSVLDGNEAALLGARLYESEKDVNEASLCRSSGAGD